MRKGIGAVLIGVGLFGVVLAILMPTVVVNGSKKTPLDLNITQVSSGPAKLLDPTTNQVKDVQLRATRVVKTDSHASDGTNTTVFETLCIVVVQGSTPNCVKAPDPRLLSVTTDRVTADRRSAESVHVARYSENVNGDTSVKHTGLSYKFPIDTKKKTYQFFQPDVAKAYPAVYKGTSKIRGLTVYKFVSETGSVPYKVNGLFDGTYTDTRTVWVEPGTGAIINGTEHQVQALSTGQVALDTTLSFEKSAIDSQAKFAKDKIDQLRLAQLWGPLVVGVLGIAALVGAFFLLRRRKPAGGDGEGSPRHGAPTPDDDPTYAEPEPPVWAGSSQT
jgi:Porin PorA